MGTIIRYKFIVSLFNRIVLIHSAGGTILDALKIIESTETGIFKKILKSGIKKLQTGKQLEDMCSDPFFPPELKQMVKTASDTGNLGPPFQRIVMIYKRNLKTSSDKLGQVLEPISILIVGILVCVVMIATIYPIISATDSIGGK
jgi:type II secretory pathway component PulF